MTQEARLAAPQRSAADGAELRAIDRALVDFLERRFAGASCAQYELAGLVSRELADGNPCLALQDLQARAQHHGLAQVPEEQLLQDNPLLSTDGSTPLVLDRGRLYLRRYWQTEVDVAAAIAARLQTPLLSAKEIAAPLARLFPPQAGAQPDWARAACAMAGRYGIGIITGGPGTGKTTTVVRLLALLQEVQVQRGKALLHVEVAAPTGKAAARLGASMRASLAPDNPLALPVSEELRRSLAPDPKTLHRLLGWQRGTRHFRHGPDYPLLADVLVLDEASMVSLELMHALLQALPPSCRLILVGDKDQLASVEAGQVLGELCQAAESTELDGESLAFLEASGCADVARSTPGKPGAGSRSVAQRLAMQTGRLRKNWRAAEAPGILALAAAVNTGDAGAAETAWQSWPDNLQRLPVQPTEDWLRQQVVGGPAGLAQMLQLMQDSKPDAAATQGALDRWASDLLDSLARQQLLTPLRVGPDGLNALNQRIDHMLHGQPERWAHDSGELDFRAGQPVLVTRNLYELGVMNGDVGLVLEHPAFGMRVVFPQAQESSGLRWVLPAQLQGHCQHAYAITVHQSQGSEYDRVLLYLTASGSPLIRRELLYTAITRARKQFVLVASAPSKGALQALFSAARARRTVRASGLADRLAAMQ